MIAPAGGSSEAFQRRVERWVLNTMGRVESFDELVAALPGVYPPIAAEALDLLLERRKVSAAEYRRATRRLSVRGRCGDVGSPTELPPPHPLDYDWRYTREAIERILDMVVRWSTSGDTVALLGTPSLYLAASQHDLDRRFVLIDKNRAIIDELRDAGMGRRALRRDVFVDKLPRLGATVVVADPPWYREHIAAFLWAAAYCSAPRATVLISLPAEGTRPGFVGDRMAFRRAAARHSLAVTQVFQGALPYVSPPFEVNALRVAGWHALPGDWRRGDLAVLRWEGTPSARPKSRAGDREWEERGLGRIGQIRVLRAVRTRDADPRLIPLVEGDVLDAVSRRHPIRKQVDVWTTGNRIYRCVSPAALVAVIDAITSGSSPSAQVASNIRRQVTAAEEAHISQAIGQLRRLAHIEDRELAQLGWTAPRALPRKRAS